MNLGLGNELKLAFPNIKPITRPKVTNNIIQDSLDYLDLLVQKVILL